MERIHHNPSGILSLLSMAMRLVQQIHQTPRQMLLMLSGHEKSEATSLGDLSAELLIKLNTAVQYMSDLEKIMMQLWGIPPFNFDMDPDNAALMVTDDPNLSCISVLSRLHDAAQAAMYEFSRHSNRWRQTHRLAGTSFAAIKQPTMPTLACPPAQVANHLSQFRQAGPEIMIETVQGVANINEPGVTVLIMTISRVCRVMIALHGLLPEWLIVRGLGEAYLDSTGKPDLFTPSETQTFRSMTHCCLVAMQTVSAALRESKLKNLLV